VDRQALYEQFVQDLIANQDRLYTFILALLADSDRAEEVLQETNVVLCRKLDEYAEVENFVAWAYRVARFQVMAYRKRRFRDRHVFDDELVDMLAYDALDLTPDVDDRRRALQKCLSSLHERQRNLVLRRYAPGGSVKQIAAESGRSVGVVSQTLYRIRAILANCIDRALAEGLSG